MDIRGQLGDGRHKFDNCRDQSPRNLLQQHRLKEQNRVSMNMKLLNIFAERDAAIEDRDKALIERKKALEEREVAIAQRNLAIKVRNQAVMERDSALSALQQSLIQPIDIGIQRCSKRHGCSPGNHTLRATPGFGSSEMEILDALCKTMVAAECSKSPQPKRTKENQSQSCATPKRRKEISMGEDLNRQANPIHLKLKNDWDDQNLGLNRIDYDESIMPVPGCSCTGVFRHCYKWGNGGWQSSCCTNTISVYPLPAIPNKRCRKGGRKMSGSAFSKLLTRLALEGFDFSLPVDLKDHWSKHGTNRYITIK